MVKQRFDFNIFNTEKKRKSKMKKLSTRQLKRRSITIIIIIEKNKMNYGKQEKKLKLEKE